MATVCGDFLDGLLPFWLYLGYERTLMDVLECYTKSLFDTDVKRWN